MKIGINLCHITPGKNGGMEVYVRSLTEHLQKLNSNHKIYLIGYKDIIRSFNKGNCFLISVDNYLFHNTNLNSVLLNIIQTYQFNVWYSPMLHLNPFDCPVPSAICIPDVQHRYFPEFFDLATINWRESVMRHSAYKTNLIFTLSEQSKEDIIRFYRINPKKIVVTHLDAPSWIKSPSKSSLNFKVPEKYFFYPANTWPHKNHLVLLKAFANIVKKFPNLNLICSGDQTADYAKLKAITKHLKLQNKVKFLGYVDKNTLVHLYKKAIALVYPSLFEGFGIPLIEAFNLNCPVICSKHNTSREIAGKAALYFNPDSEVDLSNKLIEFLTNKNLRNSLIAAGNKQAKRFSYVETARKTLSNLQNIAVPTNKVITKTKVSELPKISVIMPTFNQANFIKESIDSVLKQHYSNLELIVMDGGSTDKTIDILRKYGSKLIWKSQRDKGQTDAINKGLKMATGDILAYLNSDDLYEADALKKVANFFINNPKKQIIHAKGKYIDGKGDYLEDYPSAIVNRETMFYECNICQPTVFFRRQVYEKIGQFNIKCRNAMDYEYWLRVLNYYPITFVNEYLAKYRLHTGSKTVSLQPAIYKELIKISKKQFGKVSYNWILGYFYVTRINKEQKPIEQIYNYTYSILVSFLLYLILNKRIPEERVFRIYYNWLRDSKRLLKNIICKVFIYNLLEEKIRITL